MSYTIKVTAHLSNALAVGPRYLTDEADHEVADAVHVADYLCDLMREHANRFSGMEEFNTPCTDCVGCTSGGQCNRDELWVCHGWIVRAVENKEDLSDLQLPSESGDYLSVSVVDNDATRSVAFELTVTEEVTYIFTSNLDVPATPDLTDTEAVDDYLSEGGWLDDLDPTGCVEVNERSLDGWRLARDSAESAPPAAA